MKKTTKLRWFVLFLNILNVPNTLYAKHSDRGESAQSVRNSTPSAPSWRGSAKSPELASRSARTMPCDSEDEDLTGLLELIEPMQPAPPAQPTIATEALPVLAYPAFVLPGLWDERADLPTDAAALLAARAKAAGPSLGFQLSTFRVQGEGGGSTTAAILHERRPEFLPTDFHPFTTSAHLYVPATITLLSHLLSRADALLRGKRMCELGAGLGLCSCVLGRLGPASAPSRLVVTDGCEATLPLLRANLQANCGSDGGRETETRRDEPAVETVVKTALGLQVETALLPWGREPEPLASAFDLVVASDAIFDVRPPGGASRMPDSDTAGPNGMPRTARPP